MKKEKRGFARGMVLTIAVFALLISGAWWLLDGIGSGSEAAQLEIVEDAVRSALVTCYAVEGYYPESVEYLQQHYGLAYDEDRFIVYYDAFASNILPDVRVRVKGADGL